MALAAELAEQVAGLRPQCGCGHPACKRCRDDRDALAVLERFKAHCGGEFKIQN